MFLGLRSLIFQVPDLAAASQWYQTILGFKPYFDQPFYVGFNVGGFELGLRPQDEEQERLEKIRSGHTEGVCYWGVSNIRASYDRLVKLGAEPFGEIQNVGGEIELAEFDDPWGNAFGIIYNPDFKYSESLPTAFSPN